MGVVVFWRGGRILPRVVVGGEPVRVVSVCLLWLSSSRSSSRVFRSTNNHNMICTTIVCSRAQRQNGTGV